MCAAQQLIVNLSLRRLRRARSNQRANPHSLFAALRAHPHISSVLTHPQALFPAILFRLLERIRAERLISRAEALFLELESKTQHPAPPPAPVEPSREDVKRRASFSGLDGICGRACRSRSSICPRPQFARQAMTITPQAAHRNPSA